MPLRKLLHGPVSVQHQKLVQIQIDHPIARLYHRMRPKLRKRPGLHRALHQRLRRHIPPAHPTRRLQSLQQTPRTIGQIVTDGYDVIDPERPMIGHPLDQLRPLVPHLGRKTNAPPRHGLLLSASSSRPSPYMVRARAAFAVKGASALPPDRAIACPFPRPRWICIWTTVPIHLETCVSPASPDIVGRPQDHRLGLFPR